MTQKIADLLKELAIESALESKITQARWSKALVDGWQKNKSMGAVLASAAQLPGGRNLTGPEWDALMLCVSGLRPSLKQNTSLRQGARVWIANNARFANDALWDGDLERAERLMAQGGRKTDGRSTQRRAAQAEMSKDMRGRVYANPRKHDKRADWNTVK